MPLKSGPTSLYPRNPWVQDEEELTLDEFERLQEEEDLDDDEAWDRAVDNVRDRRLHNADILIKMMKEDLS